MTRSRRFFTKRRIVVLCVIVFLFGALEIFLRSYYGFCDTVLMQKSDEFEYIAQPNQKRFRFRHNSVYNSLSMRNKEEVDTTAKLILGFGDSVINGGILSEQDSLATSLLQDSLRKRYNTPLQVLNISAGSWGPDNCFAYQTKYHLPASMIFLVVSSHDAYDNMSFEPIVGKQANFPDKQSFSAVWELLSRYLFPRAKKALGIKSAQDDQLGINKRSESTPFNPGFLAFYNYTRERGIPFVIYLHAEKSELKNHSYNDQGKDIIAFAALHGIQLITDLDELSNEEFRDSIHPNEHGQAMIAKRLLAKISFPDELSPNKPF
jgi:hypothetical protein